MLEYKILIPSYNDWECLNLLIPQIDESLKNTDRKVEIIIINDCSTVKNNLSFSKIKNLKSIRILDLKKNVKAQVAIATGLAFLRKENFKGGIIIMDADGQDSPDQLLEIFNKTTENPTQTVTINRTSREDKFLFNCLYHVYIYLTFIFTFKYMKFGVYSYIHSSSLDKMLSTKDICMAYAAALAKHFKIKNKIFAPRKKRILGESKNNYMSLIYYGLKIISVFRYQVLINSSVLVLMSFLLINLNYFFLILVFMILFFNIIIFAIASQIKTLNKENILSNIQNIQNIENLKI